MSKQNIELNIRKVKKANNATQRNHSILYLTIIFLLFGLSVSACRLPILSTSSETAQPATGSKPQTLNDLSNLEVTATALSAAIQGQLTAIAQNAAPSIQETLSPQTAFQIGNLSGVIFFDLDGDGLQSENEPSIGNVPLCLDNSKKDDCTISNPDGTYQIKHISLGEHELYITSPESEPAVAFRYINRHLGWVDIPAYKKDGIAVPAQHLPDAHIQPISEPLTILIGEQTRQDIALMQGYLTNIFTCQDWSKVQRIQYFDHDPAVGSVRNYLGDTKSLDFADDDTPGTEDNHTATDFGSSYHSIIGTYVLAAAGGIVSFTGGYETPHGTCLIVDLVHPELGHRTGYVHLDKILVSDDQTVYRGQILGTLGMTCTTWAHVHFHIQTDWDMDTNKWIPTDPFRDTFDPNAVSYWTKDNAPQCPPYAGK